MSVAAGVGGGVTTVVLRSASDECLVEHVRRGSSEAFETLFGRYHPGVLAFCAHMLGSLDEAEDAAQLTFLVAYGDLVRNAHPVTLRAWLYGIARHRCLQALRTRREHPTRDLHAPSRRYEPTAVVGVRDDVRELLSDVARLPNDQRDALVLAELGGLSHAEIARVLGCPRTKVKALVFQARRSLRVARAARDTPCAEIREQLSTLRGPALTGATLRRHLDECPDCRAYRDALRSRPRRPLPRLAWTPLVCLKRFAVGGIAGSGGGAGGLALTGGTLGGAGLAVAVTIAATGGPTVARDAGEPARPIARVAAPASFPARHPGSSVSTGFSGTPEMRSATRETSDGLTGIADDAGATGTEDPAAPERTLVGEDPRTTDETAGDRDVAAPVLEPEQPVVEEALESLPPATAEPSGTGVASSGPSPAVAASPRPIPQPANADPSQPDDHRPDTTPSRPVAVERPPVPGPSSDRDDGQSAGLHADPQRPSPSRADDPRPSATAPLSPRPAPPRLHAQPPRPDDRPDGSVRQPDNRNAEPAAQRPPQSGRDGAREPNADDGEGRRETSPAPPRARPH